MSIKLAMPILLAACALPLSGCVHKVLYWTVFGLSAGPPRIQKKTERIRAQPLSRRYVYLRESLDYELALAAVWTFRRYRSVNDPKAVDHLMANLERWRPPLTDRMRRSMDRVEGYGRFGALEHSTIKALRVVYEYTESEEVRQKAKDAYLQYRDTRAAAHRPEIRDAWERAWINMRDTYRSGADIERPYSARE